MSSARRAVRSMAVRAARMRTLTSSPTTSPAIPTSSSFFLVLVATPEAVGASSTRNPVWLLTLARVSWACWY